MAVGPLLRLPPNPAAGVPLSDPFDLVAILEPPEQNKPKNRPFCLAGRQVEEAGVFESG